MDNLTHSLAGGLLGQMGLKRRSRFAMAGCILGANAPDIDIFAPRFFPVQGIAFHRGPTHAVLGWPLLAASIVGLLWLYDRWRPAGEGALPFRPLALFWVTLLAVLTHPFLDWLNTYGINLFARIESLAESRAAGADRRRADACLHRVQPRHHHARRSRDD